LGNFAGNSFGQEYLTLELGETGYFERVTFTSGSDSRDFRMVVPTNYGSGRPIGILFGFHGNLGSTQRSEPYLGTLSSYEPYAEEGYFITAALSVRAIGGYWSGGWNQDRNGSYNYDAIAVRDLRDFLKNYYYIDENRLFALGFSHGGQFCTTLPYCLPGFLAASCPVCPAAGCYTPPAGSTHTCVGTGGLTDLTWGSTADKVRSLSTWHRDNRIDADIHVFDMGHSSPPPLLTVSPNLSWQRIVTEYFAKHAKGFQDNPPSPAYQAVPFLDDFDAGTVPGSLNWRVKIFDDVGVLYGAHDYSGELGTDVKGYTFNVDNGYLNSTAVGTGLQGGICVTKAFSQTAYWRTSFVVNSYQSDLIVWPVMLRDSSGRVLSLNIQPSDWLVQVSDTNLGFRSQYAASLSTLDSGGFILETAREYLASATWENSTLSWDVSTAGDGVLLGDEISTSGVVLGACEFGLGLRGTSASVKFGYAELSTDEPTGLDESIWSDYR